MADRDSAYTEIFHVLERRGIRGDTPDGVRISQMLRILYRGDPRMASGAAAVVSKDRVAGLSAKGPYH